MQPDSLEQIDYEAREWFTLMQSGSVTSTEREQCEQWLQSSSAHQQAYRQYERIWADLGAMAGSNELAALQRSLKVSFAERIRHLLSGLSTTSPFGAKTWGFALASSVAVFCLAVIVFPHEKIVTEEFATATGEIKQITLADGSQITLGAKSEMKAWATEKERHVDLVNGQAFFKVAKNPQRPFLVDAGATHVRVVGTQFDVRKGLDRTRVAVLEGIVNVSTKNETVKVAPVVLTAGQQVTRLSSGRFEAVNSISVSELESWRNGRLMYLRASLADVVADANRYLKNSISLGSKNLADLKVTAAVSVDQMDSLPDMLSKSLPIDMQKDSQNNLVITSRKEVENTK